MLTNSTGESLEQRLRDLSDPEQRLSGILSARRAVETSWFARSLMVGRFGYDFQGYEVCYSCHTQRVRTDWQVHPFIPPLLFYVIYSISLPCVIRFVSTTQMTHVMPIGIELLCVLWAATIVAHAVCMLMVPGACSNAVSSSGTYCIACDQYREKKLRSKHCSRCGICVEKFDHHCLWINNCIGAGNAAWFRLWLLLFPLTITVSLWGAGIIFWTQSGKLRESFSTSFLTLSAVLWMIGFVANALVIIIGLQQLVYWAQGVTQFETMKKNRAS